MPPDASYTLHGNHKDSNGCCTDTLPNPCYGDVYFADCPVKWCGDLVIHGHLHNPPGCEAEVTGGITIYTPPGELTSNGLDNQGTLTYGSLTILTETSIGP